MEHELKNTVITLYKQNKWKEILELENGHTDAFAKNILWVWPSLENFDFIKRLIIETGLIGLISIGCGCGLLEWMFKKYSNLDVLGYEINREWWTSKYSVPKFIDHIYSSQENKVELNSKYALLFCYFNDGTAFKSYIRNYNGDLIFIIGPGEGRGTHTDPQPFRPNFENTDWILYDYQEVKNTKDFIAAYIKH